LTGLTARTQRREVDIDVISDIQSGRHRVVSALDVQTRVAAEHHRHLQSGLTEAEIKHGRQGRNEDGMLGQKEDPSPQSHKSAARGAVQRRFDELWPRLKQAAATRGWARGRVQRAEAALSRGQVRSSRRSDRRSQ